MSKATELARAEAEEAERDDDEREHDDEHDQELEQAPVEPEQREWPAEPTEEMFAMARELNAAHHQALRDLFGPFVEGMAECESCGGAGIAPPEPAGPDYAADPGKTTCTVCNGWGQLKTGSKAEGHVIERCDNCNGLGWVGPGNLNAHEAARAAVESIGAPAAAAPASSASPAEPVDPRLAEAEALLRSSGYAVVGPPR